MPTPRPTGPHPAGSEPGRRAERGWSATGRGDQAEPGRAGGDNDRRAHPGPSGRDGQPAETHGSDIHFINAFTDTVDLSSLRRRLELEEAAVPERTEYIPRLYSRNRPAPDTDSTQVVRRSGVAGGRWAARSGETGDYAADGLVAAAAGQASAADRRPAGEADQRAAAQDTEPAGGRGTSTKSKALWTLADQGVSSATNAAVSLLIGNQVTKSEFGAFAIAYTVFAVIIGLSRASLCLPLGIAYSGKPQATFRYAAASATGACLSVGAVVGLGLVGVGSLFGGSVGTGLIVMGCLLPGLLLQDAWRFVFFALGRPFGAFLNDVAWAAVQMVGLGLLIERGVDSVSPMLLAWGVSALIAALIGVAQAGLWPAPTRVLAWIRENRSHATNLSAEFVTVQGALQATILLIGVIGSTEMVGSLQAVRTLLAPTTVVGIGLVSFAVPELSRRAHMSARAREGAAVLISMIVVGIGLLWSLIFILFPQLGDVLLNENWPGVEAILVLSVLHYAGTAVPTGPVCVLYALGHTGTTFRINLAMAPMLFAFPLIGLMLGDLQGAVIGFNIVFWGIAPVWWILLRRVVRRHAATRLADGPNGPGPEGSGAAAEDNGSDAAGPARRPTGAGGRRKGAARGRGALPSPSQGSLGPARTEGPVAGPSALAGPRAPSGSGAHRTGGTQSEGGNLPER